MARVLPPIKVAGVTHRVLRLDGNCGPRYLLRSEAGELLGLYPYGAEPMRLYGAPLEPTRGAANPFARIASSTWTVRWWLTMIRRALARLGSALDLACLFDLPTGTLTG